jgi:RNA polymerase sigma-70 factor (ECF subfamily)
MVRNLVDGSGPDGESDQLAHDVNRHVAALRLYALVLAGDPSEADDLVRECLSRVLAQMRSWWRRPVRDLRTHLFANLRRVLVEDSRRQRIRRSDVSRDQAIPPLAPPASALKRPEFRALVTTLRGLPAQQREVLLLIGVEGMGYAEAARLLGVPVGTAVSRLARGREALRRLTAQGAESRLRAVR